MPLQATNTLVQVQTFQMAHLALLSNYNCFIGAICNTKFKDFENLTAQLGSVVNFNLPSRFTTTAGLVASWQPAAQRLMPLTVDQAANTSYNFTAQEKIFNVDKDTESYMDEFGRDATAELSAEIEANVAMNAISAVPVMQLVNGQSVPTGALHTESGPFRYFLDGETPLTSFQQLQQAITNFLNFGGVKEGIKVVLPDTIIPPIIGSGLNQFAPRRNDEIAQSWEIGEFGTPPVKYYVSNLLPIHVAGNVGNNGTVLTVVSTNDPTGNAITTITCSGAGVSDANAVFVGDLFSFKDGVDGFDNMRYLTFIGHRQSAQQVQFRVTASAGSNGSGNVVLTILPTLNSAGGANQNLNQAIQAGMQIVSVPTHRAGLIVGGNAFFLGMPRLPNQSPFDTANEYDPDTGISLRMTTGSIFGQNLYGTILDAIWGSSLVPEYCMRICLPV